MKTFFTGLGAFLCVVAVVASVVGLVGLTAADTSVVAEAKASIHMAFKCMLCGLMSFAITLWGC